ncbi:uncharacterized protein B0H18DRAFT_1033657 [Fomitopsis serialis]|uniref:uncharacterized protein n=1 Tax=Fomitopsis serialis TaxID=139415 RepID=UPI002007367D|nr:uncharacterized protein B0H18DRAFT_1033657 [Neoantrodia serialis]KAH9917735.1 hypothetical protein B0H18DRAFT_1033657 [Neoantrodia serialis]
MALTYCGARDASTARPGRERPREVQHRGYERVWGTCAPRRCVCRRSRLLEDARLTSRACSA